MSFENLENVVGQMGQLVQLTGHEAQLLRDWPGQRGGFAPGGPVTTGGPVRPSDIFQNPNAPPPTGFTRSETGGLLPGTPTGGGFSQVPATALPVNPAIFIPADFSEGARQRREQRAGGWNEAVAAQVIAQIREVIARLEQIFGGPTYVGQLFENEIRNIEAQVLTPDEALAFVRYVLGTMWAGLQQEALSPVAEIRNIAIELLRFAGGASLPGGPGSLTPGARPPATPNEAGVAERTASGIGTAVAGAVRGEISGLGATITRHGEAQADRVLAGVREQGTTITQGIRQLGAGMLTAEQLDQAIERRLLSGQ
jgi:hypothetical protein